MACAVASGLSVDSLFGLSLFAHVCMRACACACARAWKGKGTKLFFCVAPKCLHFLFFSSRQETCQAPCVCQFTPGTPLCLLLTRDVSRLGRSRFCSSLPMLDASSAGNVGATSHAGGPSTNNGAQIAPAMRTANATSRDGGPSTNKGSQIASAMRTAR